MKELYDKVQESIKDSLKDFISMGSEKEKQMLQERDAKRLLRKEKLQIETLKEYTNKSHWKQSNDYRIQGRQRSLSGPDEASITHKLMIRMLDHGMEVEDESEIAITLIHLFILWTTEDGDDS
ncbi:hypothetical protein Tco_0779925 [Tanacetum coccineum]